MEITMETSENDVIEKITSVLFENRVPNMTLKNSGSPNGFNTTEEEYNYWLRYVCEND